MKRKEWLVIGILLAVALLCGMATIFSGPIWMFMGGEPVCIQGSLPDLEFLPCSDETSARAKVTPMPLPQAGAAPVPLIFDDDGSPDGMLALLFFLSHPGYEVQAVTISPGEAHPEVFAPQAARLLDGVGRAGIPVGYGRADPLGGANAFPASWRQMSDDFWGFDLPEPNSGTAQPQPAAQLMVDTLSRAASPVTVFLSGTHTNLAEALRLDPSIADKIGAVYIMGGAVRVEGNIHKDYAEFDNTTAEWNVWVDPLAASEVFAAGLPLHMIPLDATDQVLWTPRDLKDWRAVKAVESVWAANLLQWMLDSWMVDGIVIWDLTAAAVAADARLCPQVPLALEVETGAGPDLGRTREVSGQPANAQVCLRPAAAQLKAQVLQVLQAGGE